MKDNPKKESNKKLEQILKNRISLFILLSVFTMMFVTIISTTPYSVYGQFSLGGLEYKVDISSDEIFPDNEIKSSVLNNRQPTEYTLPELKYSLLGFDISASNIEVKTETTEKGVDKLRIDFPVMTAKNVKVSKGDLKFDFPNVNLASTYAIYDKNTDKFTVHIPLSVAAKHLPSGVG